MEGIGGHFLVPSILPRRDRCPHIIICFLLLALLFFPLAIALECPDDMLSYWTLDDQTAPGKDAVGSSDGTATGGIWMGVGRAGAGRLFDGDDDIVDCGMDPTLDPGGALTVSAWVKPEKGSMLGVRKVIVSKWKLDSDITSDDAWDGVDIAGFTGMSAYKGYIGGAFDGRYLYLVPSNIGSSYHGRVARYDTTGALDADASWEGIDITSFSGLEAYKGYTGAVFDGQYLYLVPAQNADGNKHGLVARYDTSGPFDSADSWAGVDITTFTGMGAYKGFSSGTFDGRYLYLSFHYDGTNSPSGKVARFDTTGGFLSDASWDGVDITTFAGMADYKGFTGSVFDGRYIYLVPFTTTVYHGYVARYDTSADFTTETSWEGVDISSFTGMYKYKGYNGAVFDGRYIYFVPRYNAGGISGNIARYDTTGAFDADAAWDGVDIITFAGMADYKGYNGGVFDGRYLYLVPRVDSSDTHGRVARYDTTGDFTADAAWDGVDVNASTGMSGYRGYIGGVFDGRYVYLMPLNTVDGWHGRVARYDTLAASSSAYRLTWSQPDQSGGYAGAPFGPGFEVVTDAGHFGAWADEDLATGEWHHIAGVYTGSSVRIYVDGVLKGITEGASGTVVVSSAPLTIGGRAGSREQFQGAIDEVAVIDGGLNAGGVYDLYAKGLTGKGLCKEDLPEGYLPAITEGSLSCPSGMARIDAYWGSYCIDQYEAYSAGGGVAGSAAGKTPWTSITMADVRTACEAAGKRLCKDFEWKTACNLDGQNYRLLAEENRFKEAYGCYTCSSEQSCSPWDGFEPVTGSHAQCVSDAGVFDMIGSMVELTDATVPSDSWAGDHKVYVGDLFGESQERYGDDRVYRDSSDAKGNLLLRGGGWAAGSDAGRDQGCFFLHLTAAATYSASDIGFRCCSSPEDPPAITYVTLEDALMDQNQVFIDTFNEGLDHVREENYTGAIAKFEECLRIDPTNVNAIHNLEKLEKRGLPEGFVLAVDRSTEPCPEGMSRIDAYWGSYCIDQFEAHDAGGGVAGSAPGNTPMNANWNGAKAACTAAGKRLCKDFEWKAACNLGGEKYYLTEEENVNDEKFGCYTFCDGPECPLGSNTIGGSHPQCRSDRNVFDMVGSVNEWTDAMAPDELWVGESAKVGDTLGEPNDKYGNDLFWRSLSGGTSDAFARGGHWYTWKSMSSDKGCFYLQHVWMGNDGSAFGFRCCSSSDPPPDIPYHSPEEALVDRSQVFVDTFNEALDLTREEKYDEAIAKFKECLKIDPTNLNTITNLGILEKMDLPEGSLLAVNRSTEPCAEGMARINAYWGSYCIDKYEAHDAGSGKAGSAVGKEPWNLKWDEAKAACEAVGKHLCTDAEWMAACNLDGQKYDLRQEENRKDETYGCNTYCGSDECVADDSAAITATGTHPMCRSDAGVHDMIGNKGEWTDAQMPVDTPLTYEGGLLYIGEMLGETRQKYGDDALFPSKADGIREGDVFMRGGYSSTSTDHSYRAGCFYAYMYGGGGGGNAKNGFRCCSGSDQSPGLPDELADALIDRNQVFVDTFEAALDLARQGKKTDAITKFNECFTIDPMNPNVRTNIILMGGVVCSEGQTACSGSCVDLLTDAVHCSACGAACSATNANTACTSGSCSIGSCKDGYGDCDATYANGCEVPLTTDDNCGACGTTCTSGKTCTDGSCECPVGKDECGGMCVDVKADPANCGTCGKSCSEGMVCADGACSADCPEGIAECSGACVDLKTDVDNCGKCATKCPSINALAECSDSSCAVKSCKDGYGDCDKDVATGCEEPLTTDADCGACGNKCTGGKLCLAGSCGCPTGRTDCDGLCIDLQADTANCGACGRACSDGQVCAAGSCSADCPEGTTECSGACVDLQTNTANCGACATACSLENGSPQCVSGTCAVDTCIEGYGDCDSDYTTGCETSVSTIDHCGGCGITCTGGKSCLEGNCTCPSGRIDCDGTCVDTNSNPQHCGACGTSCSEGQVCATGVCAADCPEGTTECSGACIDVATDVENCGACSIVCSIARGTVACAAGSCAVGTCNKGFGDCDEDVSNGCEAGLDTDLENCGACDNVCGEGEVCRVGVCTKTVNRNNGEQCQSSDQCASANCVNRVCCVAGKSCCAGDADCLETERCDAERFFCIARETTPDDIENEKLKEEAETQLAQARALLEELKAKNVTGLDTSTIDSLIAEAVKKGEAGDHASALKVALDAVKAAEEEKDKVKLSIGTACTENRECDTSNCQNKLCCKAGETCCSDDAHCKGNELCDKERHYCVSKGERKLTIKERVFEMLTDPEKLITIVGAIVAGLGFGIYQLKAKIAERKGEGNGLGDMQQQIDRMAQQQPQQWQQPRYYQGPGGQWYQYPQQGQQQWGQQPGGQQQWGRRPRQ